ncbi:FkbM family methyltransferase [Limnospira sp. PMC 917.15]|uniref:FkbM family methyltransferase n=1 Tax=Limnospira sp. PMC 917.15 TaxID=2981106 RepID=UPI0028E12A82|nr:FkbM family methyltransferase [Limnospira sp. PMC 917.15]MDT9234063.1 FkbM family methyltransferase [Limnospira sp. PMC 917.15]
MNSNQLDLNFVQLSLMQTAYFYRFQFGNDWRKDSAGRLQELFKNIQKIIKPKVCIEAGAHEANFSISVKKLLPHTSVYAFEADPTNYEHFKKEKGQDFDTLGVNYLNLAIGDKTGILDIHRHKDIKIAGNNSLKVRKQGGEKYEAVSIPIVSLDDFFGSNEFSTDDFSIWIDTEGCAYKVLQGAEKQFLDRTLSLFVEVEDKGFWLGQKQSDKVFQILLSKSFIPLFYWLAIGSFLRLTSTLFRKKYC